MTARNFPGLGARWTAFTGGFAPVNAPPLRLTWTRLWPFARPYGDWLTLITVLVLLGPVAEAATLWMFRLLVDQVLVPANIRRFPPIALAYLALTLGGGVLSFFDRWLSAWTGERMLLALRTHLFAHVQTLSFDFFRTHQVGDLVSRLSGDIDSIETLLISGIVDAVSHLTRALVFLAMLFYISPQLAAVSLTVTPLFALATHHFSGWVKVTARERRRRAGSAAAVATEALNNVTLVRAFGAEAAISGRYRRENLAAMAAQLAAVRLKALFSPLIDLLEVGGMLVVLVFGALQLARGALTLGELLVFTAYLSRLYGPVRDLSRLLTTFQSARAGAERVVEVLNQQPGVQDHPDAAPFFATDVAVEFDAVGYRYPGGAAALAGLSFTVRPGEVLAIVGPSGAGKSTVLAALLRLFDPVTGSVRLNGHDLRTLTMASVRAHLAVALQDTYLLNGTVRDNIAFGAAVSDDAAIERAARRAGAHEFIAALPDRYETVLGEHGSRLSGGQRQRIAIARALYRDAPLLLLDEPTTGLDAHAARALIEPLHQLMRGRTCIMVTHDLALVRNATHILYLESGRSIESGDHQALMRRDGAYARLVRRGLSAPETEHGVPLQPSAAVTAASGSPAAAPGTTVPARTKRVSVAPSPLVRFLIAPHSDADEPAAWLGN